MLHIWQVAPLCLVALVAAGACSSSSSSPATDGGTEAAPTSDSGSGSSSGGDSSSGGGTPCKEPTDCTSGDVCCGTIPITGGTVPNCTTSPIELSCAAPGNCKTNLSGFTCMGTKTVRICQTNADCTETGAPKCCTFGGGDAGGGLTFCANDIVAGAGGGTCQ
jgi:hypothetical protein